MIRLHQLFLRQGISFIIIRNKQTLPQNTRTYSKSSGDDCGKKSVSCLGVTDTDTKAPCPKPPSDVCQQGMLKVPPLPAECRTKESQAVPVYDPMCMRPYANPCKDSVKTCKNDMIPRPCVTPCERKKPPTCLGEPDCAYERKIDWGLRARQLLLALGAVLGGLILYRLYGSEPKEHVGVKIKKDRRFTRPMEFIKIPDSSSDIPDKIDYLIIGGGTAAYAAQQAIRNSSKDAKVLIISGEPPFLPAMRPPLSKSLWLDKDRERALDLEFKTDKDKKVQSLFFEPEKYYVPVVQLKDSPGVGVAQGYHVKKLLPKRKMVVLEDGKKITYDKCLLATGGKPRVPPPFDEASQDLLKKVTFYRNSFDFQELEEMIQEGDIVCLAIVGGGLLGTELAAVLKERTKDLGINIVNVVKDVGNMTKVLPTYLAKRITSILSEQGIQVMTNSVVEDMAIEGSNIKLYVTNDHCVTASHVIIAAGIDPNTELAEGSCLELDPVNGGFLVNSEMQLAAGIYAAGDCASFFDCDLGRRREEHHYNAMSTGKIAGENMGGKSNKLEQQPFFGCGVAPDYVFEAVGKVDATKCCTVGVFPKEIDQIAVGGHDEEDDDGGVEQLRTKRKKLNVKYVSNDGKNAGHPPAGKTGPGNADGYDIIKDDEVAETLAGQTFDRGVVYYLNEEQVIIGILLINLPGKMSVAQGLLKEKKTYDDINDVTTKFELHSSADAKEIGNKKGKRSRKQKRKTRGKTIHDL